SNRRDGFARRLVATPGAAADSYVRGGTPCAHASACTREMIDLGPCAVARVSHRAAAPQMVRNRDTFEGELHDFAVGTGRDILVVDDNETSLIAIEAALETLGRRLVVAHSGVEALARLLEQDFAL